MIDFDLEYKFREKFGHIYCFITGGIIYNCKKSGKSYEFPKKYKMENINLLMQKSLANNHDYVFDLLKNNELHLRDDVLY